LPRVPRRGQASPLHAYQLLPVESQDSGNGIEMAVTTHSLWSLGRLGG